MPRNRIKLFPPLSRQALVVLLACLCPIAASAQEIIAYGPYDYTNPEDVRTKLPVVEQYHFNRGVETLTDTMPGGSIGGHLWYVIRSFPNHHRALASFARLWRESLAKGGPPSGVASDKSPDYVFQRAMEFAPSDGMVPLIYGLHLLEVDQKAEARKMLERAASLDTGQPELNYNLGLAYVKLEDYEIAARYAERAYAMDYPLPGLRNRLIAVGAWPPKAR